MLQVKAQLNPYLDYMAILSHLETQLTMWAYEGTETLLHLLRKQCKGRSFNGWINSNMMNNN